MEKLLLLAILSQLVSLTPYPKNVQNLLEEPIYISSQSYSKQEQLLPSDNFNQLTISLWTHIKSSQPTFHANLLKYFNLQQVAKKNEQDPTLPSCPYTAEFLKAHQEYLEYEFVKQNKNCSVQVQGQAEHEEGVFKLDVEKASDKVFIVVTYLDAGERPSFTSQKIEVKENAWVYLQVSFDIEKKLLKVIKVQGEEEKVEDFTLGPKSFSFSKNY